MYIYLINTKNRKLTQTNGWHFYYDSYSLCFMNACRLAKIQASRLLPLHFLLLFLWLHHRRRRWLPRPPVVWSEPDLADFDLRTLPMSNLRTLRLLSTCRISPTEFYLEFSDLPTSRFVAEHFSSDLTFSFMTLNLPSNVSCCLTFTEKSEFFNNNQDRSTFTAKMAMFRKSRLWLVFCWWRRWCWWGNVLF